MFTPTTDVPTYITPEAHTTLTSSTPSSFDQIPPILRFQDDLVEVAMEPNTGWGWTGRVKGRIWVTEDAIIFLPADAGAGFKLLYPALTLHALTPASADSPAHVYCQIDETGTGGTDDDTGGMTNGHGANGDAEDEEEFSTFRELRIYVADPKVQELFDALSRCSALHDSLLPSGEPSSFVGFGDMPNGPEDEEDEDDDEDDGVEPEEGQAGRVDQVDQVDRFLGLVDWGNVQPPSGWSEGQDQFEDADEGEAAVAQIVGVPDLSRGTATRET